MAVSWELRSQPDDIAKETRGLSLSASSTKPAACVSKALATFYTIKWCNRLKKHKRTLILVAMVCDYLPKVAVFDPQCPKSTCLIKGQDALATHRCMWIHCQSVDGACSVFNSNLVWKGEMFILRNKTNQDLVSLDILMLSARTWRAGRKILALPRFCSRTVVRQQQQ